MNRTELHFTTHIHRWVTGLLAAATLVGIYAVVDLHDRNVDLSNRVAGFQARGCPETFHGKRFVFSAYENVNVTRPKYARLACYYQKGTMS